MQDRTHNPANSMARFRDHNGYKVPLLPLPWIAPHQMQQTSIIRQHPVAPAVARRPEETITLEFPVWFIDPLIAHIDRMESEKHTQELRKNELQR